MQPKHSGNGIMPCLKFCTWEMQLLVKTDHYKDEK